MKTCFFLLLLSSVFFYAFQANEYPDVSIRTKDQVMPVAYNGTYKISGNSFQMIFKMPKEESVVVAIANLTDKKIYDSYLKNKALDKLDPFKFGHALSVAINTIGGIDPCLYLDNDANQILLYEGQHFSGFKQVDSTDTEYTLTHEVSYLHDFRNGSNKKYPLNKFKDTLYCIADMPVYKKDVVSQHRVIPFKLVFAK